MTVREGVYVPSALQHFNCGEPDDKPVKEGRRVELPAINGFLLETPIWETHPRGTNYLAIIDANGQEPGGLERQFVPKGRGECLYFLERVAVGAALEFGANWITCVGRKKAHRWYGVVVDKTAEKLVLEQCASGVRAAVRARDLRQ